MSSQKSTDTIKAVEPKRHRGRLRVAAILEAGTAVFAEKGFDAATMTEIAARADTAIGSLYRFFPTKEVLGDAILELYGDRVSVALNEIAGRAGRLSPSGVADALVDLVLDWQAHRAALLALLDARDAAAAERSRLRRAIRQGIAAILVGVAPGLPSGRAETMTVVLLHILKALKEPVADRESLVAEVRALARLYLAGRLGGEGAGESPP